MLLVMVLHGPGCDGVREEGWVWGEGVLKIQPSIVARADEIQERKRNFPRFFFIPIRFTLYGIYAQDTDRRASMNQYTHIMNTSTHTHINTGTHTYI